MFGHFCLLDTAPHSRMRIRIQKVSHNADPCGPGSGQLRHTGWWWTVQVFILYEVYVIYEMKLTSEFLEQSGLAYPQRTDC